MAARKDDVVDEEPEELDDEEDEEEEDEPEEPVVSQPLVTSHPAPVDRSYRVVIVQAADGGTYKIDHRSWLSTRVYDRRVAIRYAAFEAKQMVDSSSRPMLALIDPAGRMLGMFHAGSGRPAAAHVVRVVRKLLRESTGRPTAVRKKKTSRQAVRRRR